MSTIEEEYNGVSYSIDQEAIDDLKNYYGIDAISEIHRAIDLHLKDLTITVTINDGTANLIVTK